MDGQEIRAEIESLEGTSEADVARLMELADMLFDLGVRAEDRESNSGAVVIDGTVVAKAYRHELRY